LRSSYDRPAVGEKILVFTHFIHHTLRRTVAHAHIPVWPNKGEYDRNMIGCVALMAINLALLYASLIPVDRRLPPAMLWLLVRDFHGYLPLAPV